MSASTEKKLRQAAREAGTDKKTLALEKEAKEKAKSKRRWTLGTIAVLVLILLVVLVNSPLIYNSTAYSVGSRDFSAAEVSYHYANQYNNFVNQYGSYASMFGLDTANGISGLDKQDCPLAEGSWKDYFLDAAKNGMLQTTALTDYAAAKGIALDESEKAEILSAFDGLKETAKLYGYGSADKMLAANYGAGVTQKLVQNAYLESALANKVVTEVSEGFTYTPEELEAQYQSYEGSKDCFDYSYVYVAAEKIDPDGEDGEQPAAATEETRAAAKALAEAIAQSYREIGTEEETVSQRMIDAAAANGQSSTDQSRVSGSALPAAKEWMMDSTRRAGDITVEADSSESGYYVVAFAGRDDNHYKTASVRHILIKAAADENGAYSEEAKAAAKARAEEILAEFEAGDRSEESFAVLAEQYSEDAGSNTKGGLYEDVAKGQMVQEFNDFCFGGHKPGDTGIVYGESAAYAGYHVMYYVGEGELYSDTIALNDLRSAAEEAWMTELLSGYETKDGFGLRFVK